MVLMTYAGILFQAMAPAYSYIHPQYLYNQQLQQSYVMPQMAATGYAAPYADRPASSSDHHHPHHYSVR